MNEKTAAESQLRDAAARFVAECGLATEGQWRFRPDPSHWSMADVAEHVALSNRTLSRMLSERILSSPIGGRAPDVSDAEIPYLFYRGDEPPNVAAPTGALADRQAAGPAVDASARPILEWARGVTLDLRTVGLSHPVFGMLDGIQWLLFTAAHLERHRAQLIGLRRHRNAPV